jgi:hypothetical protein
MKRPQLSEQTKEDLKASLFGATSNTGAGLSLKLSAVFKPWVLRQLDPDEFAHANDADGEGMNN